MTKMAGKLMKDPLLQTHYEILGLKQTCGVKEIREAFLNLSKKIHPDLNPDDPSCHQSFLKLNEAYTVLIKPEKRQIYDASLMHQRSAAQHPHNSFSSSWVEANAPYGKANVWKDETLWSSRDKSKDKFYESKPYYGINGVKRVPNAAIAAGCVIFMMVGAAFHFVVVKASSDKATEVLDKLNNDSVTWYLETRRKALANGNRVQLERLSEEWKDADKTKK